MMEDILKSHKEGLQYQRKPLCESWSWSLMTKNHDFQQLDILYVLYRSFCFFFVPFPPVLSYHVVTLELWQLLYENGDPHIIFNNYSKSAKCLSLHENWISNEKNLNVEDNIGVPFGIRLKIRLWKNERGWKCSNSRYLIQRLFAIKDYIKNWLIFREYPGLIATITLRTFSRQLFFCLVRLKCHTLIISQFLIKVIETLVLSWLFAQIHVYQNVIQC